jgi:hypothetical protein
MKEGVQPRVHTLNSLEYMHQKKKEIRNQNKNKAYQVLKTKLQQCTSEPTQPTL